MQVWVLRQSWFIKTYSWRSNLFKLINKQNCISNFIAFVGVCFAIKNSIHNWLLVLRICLSGRIIILGIVDNQLLPKRTPNTTRRLYSSDQLQELVINILLREDLRRSPRILISTDHDNWRWRFKTIDRPSSNYWNQ